MNVIDPLETGTGCESGYLITDLSVLARIRSSDTLFSEKVLEEMHKQGGSNQDRTVWI